MGLYDLGASFELAPRKVDLTLFSRAVGSSMTPPKNAHNPQFGNDCSSLLLTNMHLMPFFFQATYQVLTYLTFLTFDLDESGRKTAKLKFFCKRLRPTIEPY